MIRVCGNNEDFQLGEESNNKSKGFFGDNEIISPSVQSQIDPSSLLSYSVYLHCTIIITKNKKIQAIGTNINNKISRSLPQEKLDHFTEFEIKDEQNNLYIPISAVCGFRYTLYLVSNPENNGKNQLAYSYDYIYSQYPIILETSNRNPVKIFGGENNSAAVDSEGAILFIPFKSFSSSPKSPIEPILLPAGEKASSIACCNSFLIALSSTGKVFEASVPFAGNPTFSETIEFQNREIVHISGICDQCLAVTKDGQAFGRGTNMFGRLGLGKDVEETEKFTQIEALKKFNIFAAYAGFNHSLFLTDEGAVLGCGVNSSGELFLADGPSEENVFFPVETTVKNGAFFCIAGCYLSVVFVGCEVPPNEPNCARKKAKKERSDASGEVMRSNISDVKDDVKDEVDDKENSSKCCLLL